MSAFLGPVRHLVRRAQSNAPPSLSDSGPIQVRFWSDSGPAPGPNSEVLHRMSSPSGPLSLSVVILTQNEGDRLADAIASLPEGAEVVVVDGGSQDNTLAVARTLGARILERPFDQFSAQRAFALSQVTSEWVLFLDADERLDAALRASIRHILMEDLSRPGPSAGFRITRANYYGQKQLKHGGWHPRPLLRLVRRAKARLDGRSVHEQLLVEGPVETLSGQLHHFPYRNVEDHVRACLLYARLGAQEAQKRPSGTLRPPSSAQLLLHPLARFLKRYLLSGGFLDGIEGLIVAAMGAYTVFLRLLFVRQTLVRQTPLQQRADLEGTRGEKGP